MMTSPNGNIFRVTGHLCGEFTGHWWPVNSPHKGQWRGVLMFSLSCAWINDWVNNREAGGLKRHRAHYDLIVMDINMSSIKWPLSFLHPMICVCYRWWNSGILRRATPSLSTARHMETLPSRVWHLTKREEGNRVFRLPYHHHSSHMSAMVSQLTDNSNSHSIACLTACFDQQRYINVMIYVIYMYLILSLKSPHNGPLLTEHDDVVKWKHFRRYWPFVQGIDRSPVNSQWRGALMFSVICAWINGWVNNREAANLRRHLAYYDIIVTN